MAKVPEDIKAKIKNLSEKFDVSMDELKARFKEILNEDETIASMDVEMEVKMRVAVATLISEYVKSTGQGVDFAIRAISKSNIRKTKTNRTVADVYAIVKEMGDEVEDEEIGYATITMWDDAVNDLPKIQPNEMYKATLGKKKAPFGFLLSSNDQSNFSKSNGLDLPELKEFFKENIFDDTGMSEEEINDYEDDMKILIPKADLHVADPKNNNDIRVIKAMVIRPRKGQDVNGKEWASYGITDKHSIEEFTAWCSPDMMKYGIGSECYFVGNISKRKSDGSLSMNTHFIIPAGKITPLRIEAKPVGSAQSQATLDEEDEDEEIKEDE